MSEWLSNWDAARRCRRRTLVVSILLTGGILGIGHYLISGRSDPGTSIGAGAIAAIVVGALVSSNLWPDLFRTPLGTNRGISTAARLAFPAMSFAIGAGLVIAAAIAESDALAVSAVPFIGLALVTLAIRHWRRRV